MRQRRSLDWLLALTLLAWFLPAKAQDDFRISGKSIPELRRELPQAEILLKMDLFGAMPLIPQNTSDRKASLADASMPVSRAFQVRDLAFSCRIEWRMEKALKFPVKFRLGEVQYVEAMEGERE